METLNYDQDYWKQPCLKVDCKNKKKCCCGLKYVTIPTSLGDDSKNSPVAPKNGAYCSAIVIYEANKHVYIYSAEGVPTLIDVDATDISELEILTREALEKINELDDEVVIVFDTVNDMKSSIILVDGSIARTLGYHTKGDNGGAWYKISSTLPGGYHEVLTSGLYAELVAKETVTPEMFGAYGNGTDDDTAPIQLAFDNAKVINFSPKTYLCWNLKCEYSDKKITLYGNNATLKRPNLSVDPYNMTASQMKWVQTIKAYSDIDIYDMNFDNNCFTMWQVSDGYAQEQACSILALNASRIVNLRVENCHFMNSAGDGLHIANNVNAFVSNCSSTDCFRGGFTSTGYGSEINLNGWISRVVTEGVNDGFDVEVDSSSTIYPNKYILNISNVIIDYDLDIHCPRGGNINLSNITMREFDQENIHGFMLGVSGGRMNVSNCILRSGKLGNTQTYIHGDGKLYFNNCRFIGNSSEPAIKVTQYQENTFDSLLNISNCEAVCYTFMQMATFTGIACIDNCNIKCQGQFMIDAQPSTTQVCALKIQNSYIKFSGRFMVFGKNQYAPNNISKLYLSNLQLDGDSNSELRLDGWPDVYFNNLVLESGYVLSTGVGATPHFYGDRRVIIVPTASDLTFKGWIPGNDIAITIDTGDRYQYTSGTTWTQI